MLRLVAVTDAVVASEVGGSLRHGEDIVARQGEFQLGEIEINDLGAHLLIRLCRVEDSLLDVLTNTVEVLVGDTDLLALDIILQGRERRLATLRGGISFIIFRDCVKNDRRVLHIVGDRADLVKGGGIRDQTETRYRAVGGLQADDTAERRGLTDRAAGVGAESVNGKIAADSGRHSARRTARHMIEAVRILRAAVIGGLTGGAHRKLVHIGLAEHDHTLFLE